MTQIRLPVHLRGYTGGIVAVEIACATVAECLSELENRFPLLVGVLRDSEGRLRSSVKLYVNGEDIRYRSSLNTRLRENDELVVMMPVAGGSPET